jgi:PhnB protein
VEQGEKEMTATENAPAQQGLMNGVVPHVTVRDADAAAGFYKRAFGAEEIQRLPAQDGKRLMHCCLRINGGPLMLNDAFPEYGYPLKTPQSFVLHLHVEDVDAWWHRAVEAGAEVVMPLEPQFWGDRYGRLRDPFGITWSLASPGR